MPTTPRKTHRHQYAASCHWEGSTGDGYEDYSRTHRMEAASATLALSADPSFRGDPALLNPEVLVVAAAASCQLLSFLAVTARSRIDVRRYDDEATGVMEEGGSPPRITAIMLRPRIRVAPGTDERRVRRCVELAHDQCYVANSLMSEVRIEATVIVETGPS